MDWYEIEKVITKLAKSQGFYARLLADIKQDTSGMILQHLEDQNFRDEIDLVLFLEDWN